VFQFIGKSLSFSCFKVSQALQTETMDAVSEFSPVSHSTSAKMYTLSTHSSLATPVKTAVPLAPRISDQNYLGYEVFFQTDIFVGGRCITTWLN